MKIKEGEYIRTKDGVIAKLERIEEEYYYFDNYIYREFEDNINYLDDEQLPEYITKHSTEIMDLIEVGDYVNGYKVIDIVKGFKVIIDKLELDTTTGTYKNIGIKDIKSILAHENFEDMEYKV